MVKVFVAAPLSFRGTRKLQQNNLRNKFYLQGIALSQVPRA
jgi:hypothetical protein